MRGHLFFLGQRWGVTVDRGRRGVYDSSYACFPGGSENIEAAVGVDGVRGSWIFDRPLNRGQGSQVEDALDTGHCPATRQDVPNVSFHNFERSVSTLQNKILPFPRREIVKDSDPMPLLK